MVTALGIGRERFWEGILASRSAARTVDWLRDAGIPNCFACPVDDTGFDLADFVSDRKSIKLMSRAARHAIVASELAMRDAAMDPREIEPERAGVVLGAGGVGLHDRDFLDSLIEMTRRMGTEPARADFYESACRSIHPLMPIRLLPNIAAAHVAITHGFRGENLTICTACTSGTQALGEGLRMLRQDRADVVLAGGTDAMINPVGIIGFGMLGVLSRRAEDPEHASRPFDRDRDGFVMGEGAALFVLETRDHARKRGARALAELAGYGTCSDAYRVTDERQDGSGPAQAMQRALDDAGVEPSAVDYVNAHGTGTVMNDRTEVVALRQTFGERLSRIPVSSTKSQIGHLLAAAGAVEAAACVLGLGSQIAPPTINYVNPDPECDIDVVPNRPRAMHLEHVLSNSFGFGGQNACLVFKRSMA
jgi:3-oxoacyl-[acyl-carrier-protein] synthase II